METSQGKLKPFLSREELARLNAKLGKQITDDYMTQMAPNDSILVVVTLKGALLFAADLIREIKVPIEVDFVRVASYGTSTKTSGTVTMTKDLESKIVGRHVLILDEIVDSGRTLLFLKEKLQRDEPRSVKVCALLNKASRREVKIDVDYVGQEVEDKFLVGYGLDFNEAYRNLPDVYYI